MNVVPPGPPAKSRGRLMTDRQVRDEFFPEEARPSLRWIRENIPNALKIGRQYYYYPGDVEDYLVSRRGRAS